MRGKRNPRLARFPCVRDPLHRAPTDETSEVLALRQLGARDISESADGALPHVVGVLCVVVDQRARTFRASRRQRSHAVNRLKQRRRAHRHRLQRMHILDAGSVAKARRTSNTQTADAAAAEGSEQRLSADRGVDRRREIPVAVEEVDPRSCARRLEAVARRRVRFAAAEVILAEHA